MLANLAAWMLNLLYATMLLVTSPWIVWSAIRHGKYREGFAARFLGRIPNRPGERPCVWLHAVSVGEVNLLATTIAEVVRVQPDWDVVVSTTTKTGYDLACKKYADRMVFYCPLDFTWAVAAAMRRVRPTLLVLAELELWPNLIAAAKRRGARVAIINGRLSDRSVRGYRRVRPLASRVLRQLDLVAAQDEDTAQRFRALGARPETVHATGSLKFDGAGSDRDNPRTAELRGIAGISDGEVVLLAGSTQAPEEQYALDIFRKLRAARPNLRLILVPRHRERFDEVAALLEHSGAAWQRRSALPPAMRSIAASSTCATHSTSEVTGVHDSAQSQLQSDMAVSHSRDATPRRGPWDVLLVDAIGELGAWWGAASIGFVGGSFGPRGGQNMLEPAAYGVATCFGPNTRNFRDIVARLLAGRGAVVVHDAAEFEAFVWRCLDEPTWAAELGERARKVVSSQQGATARTVGLLTGLVGSVEGRRIAA